MLIGLMCLISLEYDNSCYNLRNMLSVIIPSYKDPLLHKTIDSLLTNAEGEIEVIPVLDGYWPETPIVEDERVRILHLGKNRGMRGAINAGVRIAQGEFIMRSDEHCMFGKGYDVILTRDCKPNWIVTARRYYLDTEKWEIMDISPVDYEKLKIRDLGNGAKKFEGVVWNSRAKRRKNKMIDETMAMQGSMWVMPKEWWEKVIVELDTKHYGTMYQDSHEMQFKTWKAGGKLMVNKNTWFAHKHVSFPRTHQYSRSDWESGVKYAYETWKDYYQKKVRPKWKI
jgi:glycosyltransferase involved in cell wall biosynthesis